MKKLIKKILSFFLYCFILISLCVTVYSIVYKVKLKHIPPPSLSDSYSLNEKLEFIRRYNKTPEIIGIGSSTCLNNLSSETVTQKFKSKAFLNASSWGMTMKDNYILLQSICKKYVPKTILIASTICEFEIPSKKINATLITNYLKCNNFLAKAHHVTEFNLGYYIENIKYKKMATEASNSYESLMFDEFGSVNIDTVGFKISEKRWNLGFNQEEVIQENYLYLDSLSAFCQNHQIKMLFFESPFREGLYAQFNQLKKEQLKMHNLKTKLIVEKHKQSYIETSHLNWNDKLFIDGLHMNKYGAMAYTEYCLNKAID